MEQLDAIASQLGIDHTTLFQFAIVIFMFFVTKSMFFNVLQGVLDERVENTTGLDGNADELIEKAQDLQNHFQEKIKVVNQESIQKLVNERSEITKKYDQEYKSKEEIVNKATDEKIQAVLNEVQEQKQKVLSESRVLAESLVNKLS